MNKTILKIKLVTALFVCFLIVTSCGDDDNNNGSITQEITKEEIQKTLEVEKSVAFIDQLLLDQSLSGFTPSNKSSKIFDDCIEFSIDQTSYTLTFNDCTIDGDRISGKINVSYMITDQVILSTITFENFSFNEYIIDGNKTSEYEIDAQTLVATYTTTSDVSMTLEDGSTATISGTKEFTINSDNTITVSGSWNVSMNGQSYDLLIDPSLQLNIDCAYAVSGIVSITSNGLISTIDYGNGTCDNLVTVTYPDGTTEELEL